jgi:diphosphomevalonate decarboxylase
MTSEKKARTIKAREVTCSAPVNIAVIKYWGKRNTELLLPTNSSLSLTLSQDHLRSTTTIRASPDIDEDKIYLNGKKESISSKRLKNVIDAARQARAALEEKDSTLEKISIWPIAIASRNNFPTAAGLASSASGFACLTFALAQLYELPHTMSEISRFARMGSGSACRSLFGGFVKWEMGVREDGADSFAVQVADENKWDGLEALILVVSDARKDTGSTEGMQLTVETSDLLKHRIEHVVPERMQLMEKAILENDFDTFAEITMKDSNQFHAVCLDTYPPIFYLNDVSKAIIKVISLYNSHFLTEKDGKRSGYRVAYTYDAGPNAVLYLHKENVPEVLALLNYLFPSSIANEEYFGRATNYLGQVDQKKVTKLATALGLKPWPVDCLRRIISTVVGDGPRLLSREFDSSVSLLTLQNVSK